MKIALSPLEEYVYPIMNWKGIKITQHVSYGGEDSESYPCGFVSTLVYERVVPKKRSLDKRLRAVANRVNKPSSTNKPNG